MSARQGSYSHLYRVPHITESLFSGRDRTLRRLAVEKGDRALGRGSPNGNPCLNLCVDLNPRAVNVPRTNASVAGLRKTPDCEGT
jgi:hypothetical protein